MAHDIDDRNVLSQYIGGLLASVSVSVQELIEVNQGYLVRGNDPTEMTDVDSGESDTL